MRLDVRADVKGAQRFVRELDKRAVPRAAARAMNDTITTVRAEGAREIKKRHPQLKIGDIKHEMKVTKANQYQLHASVDVTGKPTSLLIWGARQVKKHGGGVTARIGQTRRMATYKGRKAFIIESYKGEVFVRRFATGRQVRRLRGPSLPGVFRAQERKFKRIAEQRWPRAFKSRMDFEIDKAAKKAAARAHGSALQRSGAITSFAERQFRLPAGALR